MPWNDIGNREDAKHTGWTDNTTDLFPYVKQLVHDVLETEKHIHNRERWLGIRVGWDGTNEVNSATNDSVDPFQLDAGNDTWGTAKCIIGSGDTPLITGNTYYDMHRIVVHATEQNALYRLRFAWGADYATAVAAGNFSEIDFMPVTNLADSGPSDIRTLRLAVGTKIFAAAWCRNQNTGTIDFTIGVHEYDDS